MHIGSLKLALAAGIAGAALTGCGSGEVEMQPGRYEMIASITEISLPGAPPGATEAMKEAAKQPQTACLTPEDVKNPAPKLTPRQDPGAACQENTFTWKGGSIDGKLRCSTPNGDVSAEMKGEYRRDGFTLDVASQLPSLTGEPGGELGRIKMRSEGRRVGECDGTEKTK
jgi:hypothetical protein